MVTDAGVHTWAALVRACAHGGGPRVGCGPMVTDAGAHVGHAGTCLCTRTYSTGAADCACSCSEAVAPVAVARSCGTVLQLGNTSAQFGMAKVQRFGEAFEQFKVLAAWGTLPCILSTVAAVLF
jgi:hypothetical protein